MKTETIGGKVCKQPLASRLLHADPRELTRSEVDGLWRIFRAIGRGWENTAHDSAGQKSSWLEFVTQKATIRPSYIAEYVNALEVTEELIEMYGEAEAFERLFLDNGIPPNALGTRLAHAKHFVVDEFIRVQIIAGGFKNFIRPHEGEKAGDLPEDMVNYNGFISVSRYNRIKPVRQPQPKDASS